MDQAWLPPGKTCAICFSVDDVHPAGSTHGYDAGGDHPGGVLGEIEALLDRFDELRATLCVTPDWRLLSPTPRRRWLANVPLLSRHIYLSGRRQSDDLRIDNNSGFVRFLKDLPRLEIVPHGLHHLQRGPNPPLEFEHASRAKCRDALRRSLCLFEEVGLAVANGHSPPGWAAPEPLLKAMVDLGLEFVASARDIVTPIEPGAVTAMSGLRGQPLFMPGLTRNGLVHIPTNWQATSTFDRAFAILDAGGLLSVKAHAVKRMGDYVALDGLDREYRDRLADLFEACRTRYGDSIWWATMGDVSRRSRAQGAGLAA